MQERTRQHVRTRVRIDVGRGNCTGRRPTLMNSTSGFASARSLNTGAIRWHGPHHVAVKSTTTSFDWLIISSNSCLVLISLTIVFKLARAYGENGQ